MVKRTFLYFIRLFFLFLSIVALVGTFVADYYFMGLTTEQIIFHIRYYRSIIGFENSLLIDWRIIILICFVAFFIIGYCIKKYYKDTIFCVLLFVISLSVLEYKHKFGEFIYGRFSSSNLYEKYYLDPREMSYVFPRKKKNIIIVFWESIEKTYSYEDVFGANLLDKLNLFSHYEMGHYNQISGSNWTIASMVTAFCSIPLTISISENNYGKMSFLPNVYCLPQILEKAGYQNIWLSTSFADFGYMDKFFVSHGFRAEHIYDAKYFEKEYGEISRKHFYGYDDVLMFSELKKIIKRCDKGKSPFFLTVNTINTHIGVGLPDYCEKKFNDYRDNVRCSARQIADFLEWFLKQEISQDSVLLIIGDHFSIDSAMIKRFMGNCQNRREIFNLLFSDKVILSDKNRHFSGLDILPTLLDAAGVEWGNKKLGLGVSLLTKNEENLIEKNGLSNLNRELMKYNKIYSSFLEDKRNQL